MSNNITAYPRTFLAMAAALEIKKAAAKNELQRDRDHLANRLMWSNRILCFALGVVVALSIVAVLP